MYAQVVQGGTGPELRDQMNAIVREQLVPALWNEPGFRGAVNLEDRTNGHGMMITFWDTEEQAGSTPESEEFKAALAAILTISTGECAPIRTWHVNMAKVLPASVEDADARV